MCRVVQEREYRERVIEGIHNHQDSTAPQRASSRATRQSRAPSGSTGSTGVRAARLTREPTRSKIDSAEAAMVARQKMKEQLQNKAMLLLAEAERAASALEAKASIIQGSTRPASPC